MPDALQVLVVEDDPAIARTVVFALQRDGLSVVHVSLLSDASRELAGANAVVLDIGLPDGSGLDWCRAQRTAGIATPMLMLSARGEEIDRVLGLELGADDYLPKPFSPRELSARVRALLRRAQPAVKVVASASIRVAVDAGSAWLGDAPLSLTRLELLLLDKLWAARGRVLSRAQLLQSVWDVDVNGDGDVTERTVDTHIKTLRAKIRATDANADPIETVRGMGYCIR
jgi:two-component system, OmpR family, catabolic regulation response regulator CreB